MVSRYFWTMGGMGKQKKGAMQGIELDYTILYSHHMLLVTCTFGSPLDPDLSKEPGDLRNKTYIPEGLAKAGFLEPTKAFV